MMYLLTQPAGARPNIVDDRNFYQSAGAKKWVKSGFLNKDIKIPLGAIWSMRTQVEADLLVQNLFLAAEAMGLGAWIHGVDLAARADGRSRSSSRQVRPDAGLRFRRPEVEDHGLRFAGRYSCPNMPTCAPTPSGCATGASISSRVRVLLTTTAMAEAVRRRRVPPSSGHSGIYSDTSTLRHKSIAAQFGETVPTGGERLFRGRDRLHARHLHLHLRDARPLSAPCARRFRPRASGCGSIMSREEYYDAYLPARPDGRHRRSRSRLAYGAP